MFKSSIANNIFYHKYALSQADTWPERSRTLVDDVCGTLGGTSHRLLSIDDCKYLTKVITEMKFMPGGRYLYYAGRGMHFFNNCFLLKAEEDTREEWGRYIQRVISCLMVGGGIGGNYDVIRPKGTTIKRTGGVASGSISLMQMANECGRYVKQGGSRRSAIYASLNWQHGDIDEFLNVKDWSKLVLPGGTNVAEMKKADFNYPAPLDMTNISLNYDDDFLKRTTKKMLDRHGFPETFIRNITGALKHGEPGFSFNFGSKSKEILRNACAEITSEDDSDVCNLGSINMGAIETIEEFKDIVQLASKFLICGTLRADLPYGKVSEVREKNRRMGLGLMGIHEWLLKRNYRYEMNPELKSWMKVYEKYSEKAANEHCDRLYLNRPAGYRAIAPTGTIGILASTTTGIEPLYAVAYKRRYLTDGNKWKHEFVVDNTADQLIKQYGLDPDSIETAVDLAKDPERRLAFQADIQDYVDHAISSTINLPPWGSPENNEDKVLEYAGMLRKYAPRLRGFTCYPDGSRGGQPLTSVSYKEAKEKSGVVFSEHDVCEITGKGGTCGG